VDIPRHTYRQYLSRNKPNHHTNPNKMAPDPPGFFAPARTIPPLTPPHLNTLILLHGRGLSAHTFGPDFISTPFPFSSPSPYPTPYPKPTTTGNRTNETHTSHPRP
jgi:hypothetical protein